ncbi:hypothetical protein J7T55_002991 [Diaporthe amygdali]|uniref:uncharacterized protein n=1 Tax=Phomopsis amygdali TaxID=1214568 RepID=UPI0022FE1AF8|nr:uncharacterized protein J7T55_002991 [Diaporthe amygdali]KAJ0122478.1 hypothetical protein J7T55_002991 [Diaporthe amygdali]
MVLYGLTPSAGIPMLLVQDQSNTGPAWVGWQLSDQLVLAISFCSNLSMPTWVGSYSPLVLAQVLHPIDCPVQTSRISSIEPRVLGKI